MVEQTKEHATGTSFFVRCVTAMLHFHLFALASVATILIVCALRAPPVRARRTGDDLRPSVAAGAAGHHPVDNRGRARELGDTSANHVRRR